MLDKKKSTTIWAVTCNLNAETKHFPYPSKLGLMIYENLKSVQR